MFNINYVGSDEKGAKLELFDICNFTLNNKRYEGIIIYDSSSFAFAFELKDDNFPMLLMNKAENINKIANVLDLSTNIDDIDFYKEIYKLNLDL